MPAITAKVPIQSNNQALKHVFVLYHQDTAFTNITYLEWLQISMMLTEVKTCSVHTAFKTWTFRTELIKNVLTPGKDKHVLPMLEHQMCSLGNLCWAAIK